VFNKVNYGEVLSRSWLLLFLDGFLFGAWIGLNDKNQEGSLQWSDGTLLSYMPAGYNNLADNDCTYLRKQENSTLGWLAKNCTEIYPFICEKH